MPGSSAATSGSTDLEFLAADGVTWLGVMFARARVVDDDGISVPVDGRPLTVNEAIVAAASDAPVSEWLEPVVIEDWPGFGEGYSAAAGVDTWTSPGYALPAGASTEITVQATNNSASPIVAFCEFDGDLWIAQRGTGTANTARVMRSAGGIGALANSLNLGANEYIRDLLVFDDGTGTKVLWASSSSNTNASGRMHKWDGATWTSTAAALFGTNGRNGMKPVFWVTEDGIGAPRIFTASSGQGHVSYLLPYADPMLAPSWTEGIRTDATTLVNPVAARRHVWMRDDKNVYDFNEQGDTPALLSESTAYFGSDLNAVEYQDDYVYFSHAVGIGRVYVGQDSTLQYDAGTCSPGYLTKTRSKYATGYNTALLAYQGGILAAMFPYSVGLPLVFWGRDKRHFPGFETQNPMRWEGPFVVGTESAVITKMYMQTVAGPPSSTRLLLASWNTSQLANPKLAWISMPSVGGAMADLDAGGAHRYATGSGSPLYNATCRLELLGDALGDKGSTKFIHQQEVGTVGLPTSSPSGTDPKLTSYTRADSVPASTSWPAGVDVTTGPSQTVDPATTSGHKIEQRIDFFSPNGTATPPKPAILDSLRTTYWRSTPSFDVFTVNVEYGNGVPNIHGQDMMNDGRSVDWYSDRLRELCASGRTTMRDREDHRWTVKIRQSLPRVVDYTEGKAVVATVTVAKISGPL